MKKTKIKEVTSGKGELTALSLPEANPSVPPESYAPEGFETQEEYLDDVRETYQFDLEADQDNRDAAIEDKKFASGDQWDPEVLQERKGLPCLTIDTISQFTAQVVGDWRMNKISVKVLPAENGDQDVADIRADLIRSIETKSRATRVYDNAFESVIQCGDGAFRIGVQYSGEDVFDQDIVIQPIEDCLSVVWDRLSVDPTGRDANHCFVDDVIPEKEFAQRWPEADPSLLRDEDRRSLQTAGWLDTKTVRVTEHWRLIERERLLILFEDGTIYHMDDDNPPEAADMDAFEEAHGPPVRTRLAPCIYAQMHLVTGYKVLAGPYEWKLNRLPIIRMVGRTVSVGDKRVRHGIVRKMKDAVRLRNFFRSVAAEQLGYAPKAKWLAPESAVEGREDAFRKAHLSRDPLLTYNDDAEAPPQLIPPPPIEAALLNEAQQNAQDLKDVTGIHDASLGIKSNETSGKAINARQREGDIANLTYYDNGNASVLEAGDVMNQLIGQIYDGTRIIRIIGEDESNKLVKVNDPMDPNSPNIATGNYDVAISTGASFTTRRAEAAEAMMNAIQVYPELMQVAGDLIVKAQDWPGSDELSERLAKTIPPELLSDKEKAQRQDQPNMQAIMEQQAMAQEQMAMMQEELQKMEKENLLLKSKEAIEMQRIRIDEMKIEIDRFEAETNRLEAYADIKAADIAADHKEMEFEAHEHERAHQEKMDVAGLVQKDVQDDKNKAYDAQQDDKNKAHEAEQADLARANEVEKAKKAQPRAGTSTQSTD